MMKTSVAHIGVFCVDLEKMRAFYEKYFDAVSGEKYVNAVKGFESYILTFGGGGCRLELMTRTRVDVRPAANSLGWAHISLSVGSKENVDALTDVLRADGCRIVDGPRTTGDGFYESAVLDPEGNLVEVTV